MWDVLETIKPNIEAFCTQLFLQRSDINPKSGDRIVALAGLRNLALQPLLDDRGSCDATTTVVFQNDVFICLEDILELFYQRSALGAEVTCAMDWMGPPGTDHTLYDVWLVRTDYLWGHFLLLRAQAGTM